MGRKGKYDERTVATICRVVARTGADRPAYEAAGIAKDTFYKWLREKPDFSDRVARAREEWAAIDDEAVTQAFRESLIRAMQGADEEWTTVEETTLPDGKKVRKVSKKTVRRPPAEWAHRIAAPQVGGNFGLDKRDVTSGGQAVKQVIVIGDKEVEF